MKGLLYHNDSFYELTAKHSSMNFFHQMMQFFVNTSLISSIRLYQIIICIWALMNASLLMFLMLMGTSFGFLQSKTKFMKNIFMYIHTLSFIYLAGINLYKFRLNCVQYSIYFWLPKLKWITLFYWLFQILCNR